MPNKTKSQVIWYRKLDGDHDDLELRMPKIINSDIGFQLMFGVSIDSQEDLKKIKRHHENYAKDVVKLSYNETKEKYQ